MVRLFIMMLFVFNSVFSLEINNFSHSFNHFSGKRITEFSLMGQRCSGTKFTEGLIKKHFPSYFFYPSTEYDGKMPHKHHWPFLDRSNDYSFLQSDSCLFILVVRDPYEWLKSLFYHKELVPYHTRNSFYNFLSVEFKYKHLSNSKRFCNILDARSCEMRNYLTIGNMVSNFLIVRYEDVAQDPKKFIDFMATQFNLSGKREVVKVERYAQRKYKPISAHNMEFIESNLAWDIEKSIGYSPITSD